MIVLIVGAGNMARGIAARALAGGNDVRLVDRTRKKAEDLARELSGAPEGTVEVFSSVAEAAAGADATVLAVPYPATLDVVRLLPEGGPVVVDIANPVDFSTFDSLVTEPGTSAAEEVAAANPDARVVKAFNTAFATVLATGRLDGDLPLDVFVASDNEAAKEVVVQLARRGGLNPLDAGPLRRARELEALQFFHMTLQDRVGLRWASAIQIVPGATP
ncbi:NADPH-dependent F420 reductase [Nocardiopsis sp. LOL_012]|uniref:NADPH-dependent F420 reductase n=1 Tax=Nocardiopsis sp. LOL_012 TaxID=3345409 RepID=UPI003A86F7EE